MSKISSSPFDRLVRSLRVSEEREVRSVNTLSRTTAFLNRSRTLIKAGDKANAERRWSDAQKAYGEALRRSPKLAHVWVQYGHALKEQGFTSRAEDAYREAIKLRGDIADTHLQLGHAMKLQGKRSEAIAAYRHAYMLDPTSPHAANELQEMSAAMPSEDEIGKFYRSGLGTNASSEQKSIVLGQLQTPKTPTIPIEYFLVDNKLSMNLLNKLDPEYYYYTSKISRSGSQVFDMDGAVRHFVASGVASLAPIREGYEFEPDFYVETYAPQITSTDSADVYRHYVKEGLDSNHFPNRRAWLESLLGSGVRSLGDLELPYFSGSDETNGFVGRVTLLMNEALASGTTPVAIEARHAPLLTMMADRLVLEGNDDKAMFAYQKIIRRVPDFAPALRHYADCLLRRKCELEAAKIYEQLIARGEANIWTYINLSHCLDQVGDQIGSLRWLKLGSERFRADLGLQRRLHGLASRALTSSWNLAKAEAAAGNIETAVQRIENDCDVVFELMRAETQAEKRYVRTVALVGNFDLPQCKFYRIDQKIEQLKAAGFVVEVFDFKENLDRFLSKVHCYDAAFFFRVPAYYEMIRAIDKARETGCATFYEIDDLIFDSDYFPPSLESYDGLITQKEHDGLALGVPLFRSALRYSENALVSTKPLVDYVRHIDPDKPTYVHPNALHSPHAQHIGGSPVGQMSEKVSIFYGSGTKAHKQDFQELVEPALAAMAKKYRDKIKIILAGYLTPGPALQKYADNIVLLPPVWDVHQYWSTLSAADINLAVIKPSPTTDVKSEIKWLEAAMLGIPSVVSATALYTDVIEDGVDGMLARTPEEWTNAIDLLIRDPELRHRIGAKAREKALRDYSIPAMAKNITEIIRSASLPAPDPRKRVLVVNVFYPPQAYGGATRVVHDNIKHYAAHYRDEFAFEVYCSIEGSSEPYQVSSHASDGIRVVGVTTPDLADIDRIAYDQKMVKAFADYLDICQPDMIHFHCIQRLTTAIVLEARRRGIPYVLTVHDGWWICDEQFLIGETDTIDLYDHGNPATQLGKIPAEQFAARMQLRECLFGAEKVMAVSEAFAEIHRKVGLPNVIAVPNGVSDIEPFPRVPSPDGKVRLGFIGGLARHKGFHLIQRALMSGEFKNLRFVLIDHAMAVGTRRRSKLGTTELDIRPKVPQSKVPELYSELDVLVAPSVWPEAYGLVTREALMCGCWVLASDRGAVGEDIIEGENGFCVDVSSAEGLIEALRTIDRNPQKYLQSPALPTKLRHASDQADELIEIYREVLADKDARDPNDLEVHMKTVPEPASEIPGVEAARIKEVLLR